MHINTLILGGGLAGLSTAYHLEKLGCTDYLVLEKQTEPGGLCRSIYKDGFTLDYGGHLLHLHTPYGQKLVKNLLGKNLHRLSRRAFIYTGTSRVPYPFQANLHALPPDVRRACVDGLKNLKKSYKTPPADFETWCLRSFGKGLYQAFLKPYNTKLWGRAPKALTHEWCGPFVPAPPAALIAKSATQKSNQKFGYNSYFYYPKRGGCGALAGALAARLTHLQLNSPVTQIDLKHKTVRAGGKIFSYSNLINTLPLPDFLRLLKNAPTLTPYANQLVNQPVTVCHQAYKGKAPAFNWVYTPDAKDPFYRVGVQSSFASGQAPKGCYSLYIELSGQHRPGKTLENRIGQALLQKGIISKRDVKLFSLWQTLTPAYVVYNKKHTPVVRRVLEALAKQNCFCAGRYGRWEYSFMESALLQGQELAKKLYNKKV